jgi:hypothetical protein
MSCGVQSEFLSRPTYIKNIKKNSVALESSMNEFLAVLDE